MDRFQQLYDAGKENDNYDLQLLTDQRYAQRQASIHENPYFVNAPFSGIVGEYQHLQDMTSLIFVQLMLLHGALSIDSCQTIPRSTLR